MHCRLTEQSASCERSACSPRSLPQACLEACWRAAAHRHGLIYSSLLTDTSPFLSLPQSFSVLFLDTELQRRNAECFLMVAMTMTSGDHTLPLLLKFILVLICSCLDCTVSRGKNLKYMTRTTLKPKEKQPMSVSLRT